MPKTAETEKKQTSKTDSANELEFAVIKTGGKQYKVSVGDVISIEKFGDDESDIEDGKAVTFENVLLVDNGKDTTIGTPYIANAKVLGVVESSGRGKKLKVMTYRPKSRYVRRKGHRQDYVNVKITEIK